MECLLVAFLVLNGLLGAELHTEMKSNDTSGVSSLTSSGKISNLLRDVLNQESLVRFSMTQRIQGLVMDALDNKNNSLILKQKLNDINTELQSIEANDQKMKEENAQLKQELSTVKETIKYDKNLMMQQSESRERNISDIMVKLQSIETNNQVMKEENAMLKQELNTVKETIKYDKNLIMQQSENRERNISDIMVKLQSIETNDQVMKEENAMLKQELNTLKAVMKNDKNFITQQIQNFKRTEITALENENSKFKQEISNLKMTSSNNKRNIQNLNNMNETIRKYNDDLRLQFQMINGSLQKYDSQLLDISTELSSLRDVLDKTCLDILQNDPGVKGKDGVYLINVLDEIKKVYCDMTTDGGGWTVIQKRQDGSTDFYRNWTDYKEGFGDPSKNYWIGNDVIHHLTQKSQELRVDLLSFAGEKAYAKYSNFAVGDETNKYKLTVSGYSGTAGDSLEYHTGHKFTTRDQDNDVSSSNCAVSRHGAWWYSSFATSNLNGQYAGSAMSGGQYPVWYHWKNKQVALKGTKMMIRPKS